MGEYQLQSLKSALGPDPDNVLEVASDVVRRLRGVKTEVAATVRESGSRIGLQVISVAQALAYKTIGKEIKIVLAKPQRAPSEMDFLVVSL